MTARRRRVIEAQNVSRMCLLCGLDNPLGLRGRFYVLGEDEGLPPGASGPDGGGRAAREVMGLFDLRPEHQGYPDLLHGGLAAAILDETIGRAIMTVDPTTWGVTAELVVRYRAAVPAVGQLRALGRVTRDRRRLFEGTGEILLDDGSVAVEGRGRYLKRSIESIAPGFAVDGQWFPDERRPPDHLEL